MKNIHPYLHFQNNCEEAFNFYKSVFGGDFVSLFRFKDTPPDNRLKESEAEKIMHVSLPVGKDTILMGSDTPDEFGKINFGNHISLSVSVESEKEADDIFNKLSKDGLVTMPIGNTFWNAYFGMLRDKFGINWMVSYDYE